MREKRTREIWPGECFRALDRTVFGQPGALWEVQSVHDTADGIPHAVLRRADQASERKSIAVGVLLDRRFYEPAGPE